MRHGTLLSGIFWLIVLTACGNPATAAQSLACDKIIAPELLAVNLDDIPEERIVGWVSERYGERRVIDERDFIGRQMLERQTGDMSYVVWENPDWERERVDMLTEGIVHGYSNSGASYIWMWKGQVYEARYFDGQKGILSIDVEFDPQPTLGDLERCYGLPSHYEASFYEHNYEWLILYLVNRPTFSSALWLFYPEKGLFFADYRDGDGHDRPDITAVTPVERGMILRTGQVGDLLNDVVPGTERNTDDLKPFPGSWDNIVYD